MTKTIDRLDLAAQAAADALSDVPQWCPSCHSWTCKDAEAAPEQGELLEALAILGDQFDGRTLRLDSATASVMLHPRFPRFGITPCDSDADVIPEVLNLDLSSAEEARAIVWHLAQGRADQEQLATEAADRWEDLQALAAGLAR